MYYLAVLNMGHSVEGIFFKLKKKFSGFDETLMNLVSFNNKCNIFLQITV